MQYKLKFVNKKKTYFYIFLSFLFIWSLYETLNWYKKGLIYYGDQNVFVYYHASNYLFYYYSPLHLYSYPGVPNQILFNYFYVILYIFSKIPLYNNQEILNLVFLFVAATGFYLLSTKILSNILLIVQKEINYFYILMIAFISSIFYISNWSIIESPTFLPLYEEFIIYALLPWVFYLFIIIFETSKMNYILMLFSSLLISIVLIVGNISYLEQTVFSVAIFLFYSIFFIKRNEHIRKTNLIKKFLFITLNALLLIFYMVYPLYIIVKGTFNKQFYVSSSDFFIGNSSINSYYLSLMDLGTGGSSLHFQYPGITITVGLFLIFIAYAVPLEYLIVRKNKRLIANSMLFIAVAIIFSALYSGINKSSPFYSIIKYLFSHYNIFYEFRTNAFAVSFFYAFFLSILIAIGILFSIFGLKNKKIKIIALVIIFVLVNIIYPLPVITGEHNSNDSNINIPEYVNNAYNFTEKLNGKQSILLIPVSALWSETSYYTGVNMLQHVSKDPVITGSRYQEFYNNYTESLYLDYCNITSIIYNHNFNETNIQYLYNLFFIMNIKYVYFQTNIEKNNESAYNESLNYMYDNHILLDKKYEFGNITIYRTDISSSFLFGTNNINIKSVLTNNSEIRDVNISKFLAPINNYTFNKYYDNVNFNNQGFKIILLTFTYSHNFVLNNEHSSNILWFNSFNSNNSSNNLEIKYSSSYFSNQRTEFFIGIGIFLSEIGILLLFVVFRKLFHK